MIKVKFEKLQFADIDIYSGVFSISEDASQKQIAYATKIYVFPREQFFEMSGFVVGCDRPNKIEEAFKIWRESFRDLRFDKFLQYMFGDVVLE